MDYEIIEKLAATLKKGILPAAQPQDIDAAVRLIVEKLPGAPVEDVRAAMRVLNEQRLFDHTRTIGQAWHGARPFDASVAKRYAQALIDLFELEPAEKLLTDALGKARKPEAGAQAKSEIPEFLGLLGRIEKQRFVKTHDLDRLVSATDRYLEQLSEEHSRNDRFWHAINVIALASREKEAKVAPTHRKTPMPRPEDVRDRMSVLYKDTPDNLWVPATASEACLALEDCDAAELWLYRFLHHPYVLPFNIQSYDRQLREIWGGNPAGDGARCVDRLSRIIAQHIIRTQAQFTISTAAIPVLKKALDAADGLEKNFLGERTFSLANVRDMLAACKSIGCVTNKTGARLGTGFLIAGEWLGLAAAGPVFVTNAHVISETVPKAISPGNALVTFEVESELAGLPVNYAVKEMVFTSPPAKLGTSDPKGLDVSVVTLKPVGRAEPHFTSLAAANSLPLIESKARAYVIGHPLGGGLQISLHDSVLLDIDDAERLVHYRTPTDPASSGSPVFNTEWQVIGLHHGGSEKTPRLHGAGDYEANEAISLSAIRAAMQ
ncbi:serine protease [Bradyrhizobium sp. Ai1a-2]|uniref:serine protease n=1 Tax=Bradyrhizobium sp. Ai1a-2 TaxID=196490 RepID=UPI000403362C|nr:serine protease [Bradyrhizobium sp. Ai1a-2]